MSYGEARIAALQRKQQSLDGQIDNERNRPSPSPPKLVELRREKLRVRDELNRLRSRRAFAG